VLGGVEGLCELFGGPALGSAALTDPRPWRLSGEGGVGGDEVLAGCLGERGAGHDVDVVDGLRSQPRLLHPVGGEEVSVEVVEVLCPDRPQRHVAEDRVDVVLDHPFVAVGGGGLEPLSAHRYELLGQVPAERQLGGRDRFLCFGDRVEAGSDRFCVVSAVSGRLPPSAFPSRCWIDAVVGDDVEAVLALNDVSHVGPSAPSDRFGTNPKSLHRNQRGSVQVTIARRARESRCAPGL